MMQRYARVAGLRRRIIVPVRPLTPSLSSHWVGLVTPVPNAIARPLVESLVHEAVAHEHDIAALRARPAGRADRLRPGGRGWPWRKVRDGDGGDPLVERERPGRAGRAAAQRPGVVRRQRLHRRARAGGARAPRRALAGHRGRRRGARLVLVPARLVRARLAGPAGRRRGAAPGPARPAPPPGRRGAGLLAGGGDRARRAAAAARRDAAARPGLAGDAGRVRTDGGRSRYQQRAVFLPRGLAGHALLARRWRPSTRSSSAAWPATSPAGPSTAARRPARRVPRR